MTAPALPGLCLSALSPELRAPALPPAGPRPRRLAAGLLGRAPGRESSPGPAPRGAPAVAASAGRSGEPAVRRPPRRPPLRVGAPDFLAARPFGSPGAVEGAFAASAARRAPLRASGRPLCAELSWEFGQGRLCTARAFPEDAEHSAGTRCVAARVPGALARSGKKRAVFAFANKREPELFPSGEAGSAAPCLCFPPPRCSSAARRPRAPGRLQRTRGGKPKAGSPGPRGWGEVQERMQ